MTGGRKKGSAKIHNFCIFTRKLNYCDFWLQIHTISYIFSRTYSKLQIQTTVIPSTQ